MGETISFRVVKEPYGWAVRLGEGMMTPFRSQMHAIEHAYGIAEALRRRGERAEVVIEPCADRPHGALARRRGSLRRAQDQGPLL